MDQISTVISQIKPVYSFVTDRCIQETKAIRDHVPYFPLSLQGAVCSDLPGLGVNVENFATAVCDPQIDATAVVTDKG